MAGDHDADTLLIFISLKLELLHSSHTLLKASVVHGRRGLVRLIDRVFVAELDGALTLLKRSKVRVGP